MITSHQVAERLIPIKLTWAVVFYGAVDRNEPDVTNVLAQLAEAEEQELAVLPREKQESARRHGKRNADGVLAPFIAQGMHCGKFGLALYHALGELIETGLYDLGTNRFFEKAMEDGLLSEESTLVAMAQEERLDRSAQKQARKIIEHMQRLGYFVQREQAAA